MTQLEKILYTAKVHTTGGRDSGISQAGNGHMEVKLSAPGASGAGQNCPYSKATRGNIDVARNVI